MRILWNSDQHTLHQTTPTEHILGNLSTFYYKDHNLADVQLVIKGGDLMDRLVDARDKNLLKVKKWSHAFLHRCHEHDVAVLLLEGTDTHDWGQPKHLETQAPEGMDFRYVDTLRIEFYPKFNNLSILCVPDNMGGYTKDEVWEMALAELAKHNLKKVDIIAFHGAWDFQLPPAARGKHTHNQDRWESICEMLILSGHIHTPAQEGKVHCSGSFDRVAHGEEHPKGAYVVDVDVENKTFVAKFWENKKALPYVSLKVNEDITPEQLVKDLHEFIKRKQLPHHAQVRVVGGSAHVVNPVLAVLEKEYPYLGFKAKNVKAEDLLEDEAMYTESEYQGVLLTKENITKVLMAEVGDKLTSLNIPHSEAEGILKEYL